LKSKSCYVGSYFKPGQILGTTSEAVHADWQGTRGSLGKSSHHCSDVHVIRSLAKFLQRLLASLPELLLSLQQGL